MSKEHEVAREEATRVEVSIVDVDIPIERLVKLVFKLFVASIPLALMLLFYAWMFFKIAD